MFETGVVGAVLIRAPGQEAKLRYLFDFLQLKVYCLFLLESPYRGDSNEYTQYTIFNMKNEKHPKLSQIYSYGIFSKGTKEQVRNSHGKRAISVRAIEVLL